MSLYLRRLALMLPVFIVFLSSCDGCVVGTWPRPDATHNESPEAPQSDEACDELDNDGDGTIDEGCSCSNEEAERPCHALKNGRCKVGIQQCDGEHWGNCFNFEDAQLPTANSAVSLTMNSPPYLIRDDGSSTAGFDIETTVIAEVTPLCAGLVSDEVRVSIQVDDPDISYTLKARDNGDMPDMQAGDGLYTFSFVSPFGVGVNSTSVRITAGAFFEEQWHEIELSVPLILSSNAEEEE